jgi:hypothetical protein
MKDDLINDPDFIELKRSLQGMDPERQEAFRNMMEQKTKAEQPKPEMITTIEFASRIGVTPAAVRKWLKEGVIKGKKIGPRRWFIPTSEMEKVLRVE